MLPVRCFTCGKVIGNKELKFDKGMKEHGNMKKILDELGIIRYCCKRMFLGHLDTMETSLKYDVNMFDPKEKKI